MLYITLFVLLLMVLLNVIFRFASLFRLTVPVLYAVIVPVFFSGWLHKSETFATLIWIMLIALVILSWVITVRKRIRHKHNQASNIES